MEAIATSGYFLVELDLGIKNNIINSQNTNNKIKGILNRYYDRNSYTAGGVETAFSYIHQGEPVSISSVKCRILDPNYNPANETGGIGEDNTIFLSVRKKSNNI